MANSVERLNFLKAKLEKLSPAAQQLMAKANERSADEMLNRVEVIIPHTGDDRGGDLRATLKKEKGEGTGFIVSVGGPQAPYPANLEHGHKAVDGTKVEAVPFWYPARRVTVKRHKARAARALNRAVKLTAGVT